MPLLQKQIENGGTIRFSPKGTSMLPMLRQGVDTVTLSPLPKVLHKYDLPLYQRRNGQYVLHRIVKLGQTYTCIGDNQFEEESGLCKEQMIALVTSFHRNGREYHVTDPLYRAYCILWHYSRPIRHFWRRGINWIRRRVI